MDNRSVQIAKTGQEQETFATVLLSFSFSLLVFCFSNIIVRLAITPFLLKS
jgi:hypothetical protein